MAKVGGEGQPVLPNHIQELLDEEIERTGEDGDRILAKGVVLVGLQHKATREGHAMVIVNEEGVVLKKVVDSTI